MDKKQEIYNFLKEHERAAFTYKEMSEQLNMPESHLSKHMNKMMKLKNIYYPGLGFVLTSIKLPHRDTYKPLESQTKKVKIFFYKKE